MQFTKALLLSTAVFSVGFSISALAAEQFTCPTEFKKNAQGLWYSDQQPGWQSTAKLGDAVTIEAKNFGGAVFSPTHKRIACVYRSSDDKWVAFVSDQNANIEVLKDVKDDSGKESAWKFSDEHKDYACGKPSVNDLKNCQFTFPKA